MSDARTPDAASIVDRLLQLPAAEREAFIAAQCGVDAALRANVRRILAARELAGAFSPSIAGIAGEDLAMRAAPPATLDLERAAATARPSELELRGEGDGGGEFANLSEAPGARIGPYTLLHQIGEGGFGRVFVAEQHRPVRRQVALKVIRLGMDTRSVVARFEAERQALALMDHPNIAKVLDGGSTASGRPYFVMELVDGVPITRYCDAMKLGIPARLELFRRVCLAVQHAHQKGVIHRDIKPGNVLVAEHDGEPTPKVIDFGIAKATHARLTDRTIVTARQMFIGTPQYMSPEQADLAGADADIDTRTDIFSLGVLLYELLTGTTPLESARLAQLGLSEMQRMICEAPTPRPSTRVSALGDRLSAVAQQRGLPPERLGQRLRGDLDWIVLKATEKDRNRRYDSAAAFAAEIDRHLRNQPVEAGPPTARYRALKFVQRNRRAVIAASALAATLVLGLVGTTTFAMAASRRAAHSLRVEAFLRGLFVSSDPMTGGSDRASAAALLAEAKALFPRGEGDGDALGMANRVLLAYAERLQTAGNAEGAAELVTLVLAPDNGVVGTPDEAGVRMRLALILSGHGRHSEARREAMLAVARLPSTDVGAAETAAPGTPRQAPGATPASTPPPAAVAGSMAARANAAQVFEAGLAESSDAERAAQLDFLRRSSRLAQELSPQSTHQYRIDRVLGAMLCGEMDVDTSTIQQEIVETFTRVAKAAAHLFNESPVSRGQALDWVLTRMRLARIPAEQVIPLAEQALEDAANLPIDLPLRASIKHLAWITQVDAASAASKARNPEAASAHRERAVEIIEQWRSTVTTALGDDHPLALSATFHLATELVARVGRHGEALPLLDELLARVADREDPEARAILAGVLDQRVTALDQLTTDAADASLLLRAEEAHLAQIEHTKARGAEDGLVVRYALSYARWCARHERLANARGALEDAVRRGVAAGGKPSQSTLDCAALLETLSGASP